MFRHLAECPLVSFLSIASRGPVEETLNSFQDLAVNAVNYVHHTRPDLNGGDLVVSIRERTIEENDIDLKGRIVQSPLADDLISFHANQMATVIAGGGNSSTDSKGIAPASVVSSASFKSSFPDDIQYFRDYNITVQNHSYGFGIENIYGAEARAYDILCNDDEMLVHVFSAGNQGEATAGDGIFAGVPGFSNITGNMKMSKNTLAVGGHYKDFSVDPRNSRGPAYDGRLKPEVTAYGPEGTSDGAAYVSGVVLLLQDFYQRTNGELPPSALIRSVLAVSSDDINVPGPDFVSGYGAVNAKRAVEVVAHDLLSTGETTEGESVSFPFEIPPNASQVRVALSWNDPAAEAGSSAALVNDLDLEISSPAGEVVLPWVLNTYPHPDSLTKPAKRGRDHINNLEMISVKDPVSGTYSLTVKGYKVLGIQKFTLAYCVDTASVFTWTYPTPSDKADASAEIYLRWATTYPGTAELLVSVNGGEYVLVENEVQLENRYVRWATPEGINHVRFMMRIGNIEYESDPVLVSHTMDYLVGFDCPEEGMLQWRRLPGVTEYVVYNLNEKYMEPIAVQADTAFFFQPSDYSEYFAVAPRLEGQEGRRSLTYNYHSRGVSCYYRNFEAVVTGDQVSLSLLPSTSFNIGKVAFFKKSHSAFVYLGESLEQGAAAYDFIDSNPGSGILTYKAVITLKDGREIHSNEAQVAVAGEDTFLVYPNPVDVTSGYVNILTDGNGVSFEVLTLSGQLLRKQDVFGNVFQFNISALPAGVYLCRFTRGATPLKTRRLVVY